MRPAWLATVALVVFLVTAKVYLRQRVKTGPRLFGVLLALRVLALSLLFFVLLRPVLHASTAVPGENLLAVLIDDSRSMQLQDSDGQERGARAFEIFTSATSELARRLEEKFTLRYYRFSRTASRLDPQSPPTFSGSTTDLGAALDQVRQEMAGVPLAGLVLVSDGADNAGGSLTEPLLQLKSRKTPVYTVGLGEERFTRDIELSRVEGPRRVLQGASFAVDVTIDQRGYDGRTVPLSILKDGTIVARRDVDLAQEGLGTSVRITLDAQEKGTHLYRFEIQGDESENVPENNFREMLVTVEERRERVLYVEGEPRWEVAFLRRALSGDDNLELIVYQRSAENKYQRLGVDDPLELISGFPSTREELFAYQGLILGSVEAEFFTANQLRLIEEFVSQRGGGLLFLGGRRSFADGGFGGTPIEDLFPFVLGETSAKNPFLAEVKVAPTAAGLAHAALRLGASPEESVERWRTLPRLSTRHPLDEIKPGASLLLTGTTETGDELAVLASQRYGRGRAVAFTVQDSWMWQMHADIPQDDLTYERLWAQVLRWLVSAVPGQVAVETSASQAEPGEPLTLVAEVNDAAYLGLNGARVEATITDPTGRQEVVPLDWSVERDGEYRATFVPEQLGPYEVKVEATYGGEVVGSDAVEVRAKELPTEHFGAQMNAALLKRIADDTEGRFYTADSVINLAVDARFTESGKTVVETYELWDMPIVLLLLIALISAEWLLRRRRSLV